MKGMRLIGAAVLLEAGVMAGMWVGAPATSAQTSQSPRIAIVNLGRVMVKSAAGIAARDQIEKEKAAMQKQLDTQQAEAVKLKDELDKKGQLLSPEARREKQETLERRVRDTRRLAEDLDNTLKRKGQELENKVLGDLIGIVQRVAKERGYTVVFEARSAGILYGAPEIDLTDEVVKAYDDETKKAKK